MWGHLQWHGALAELDLGDDAAAMRRLLGPIMEYLPRGSPYMVLPDTASLLWRLALRGANGLPWQTACAHAQRHFAQGSNVFGEVHLALLAAASGDSAALAAGLARLAKSSAGGHGGAAVAQAFIRALMTLRQGDAHAAQRHWQECLPELPRIGGSHAQRAVVDLTHRAGRLASASSAVLPSQAA